MLKKTFLMVLFAFLFNLAWEVMHSLLYKTITGMSVVEYIPRILVASFGDVVMVFGIFTLISLFNFSLKWKLNKKNIVLSIILGSIIAIGFELYALYTNRFAYNATMPLIPFIKVGLTPVLQIIFTSLLTFFFAENIK